MGTAVEFLGLTPEEAAYVEIKTKLSAKLREWRERLRLSRRGAARRLEPVSGGEDGGGRPAMLGLAGIVALLLATEPVDPGYAINCGEAPAGEELRLRITQLDEEGDERVVLVESREWWITGTSVLLAEDVDVQPGWRVIQIESEAGRNYGRSVVLGGLLGVAMSTLALSSGLVDNGSAFGDVFRVEMFGLVAGATAGLVWESTQRRDWRCLYRAED